MEFDVKYSRYSWRIVKACYKRFGWSCILRCSPDGSSIHIIKTELYPLDVQFLSELALKYAYSFKISAGFQGYVCFTFAAKPFVESD